MKKNIQFSIGICAFNEAKNISKLITSLQIQRIPKRYKLREIIVIASGCTDKTVSIVKRHKRKDKRIRLFIQKYRKGKAKAVNLFLKKARSSVLFLHSADTIPKETCYYHMLQKLNKKGVGLVGCRVIPLDNINSAYGFANHLKWKLHHEINLWYPGRPKVGELIGFKKIFKRIPPKTIVDEASVEPLIHLQGYQIDYASKAIVYNQGPQNLRELLSGRRRVYAGHYETKTKYGYEVITFSNLRILPIFFKNLQPNPKFIFFALLTALFELAARTVGFFDIKFKIRDHSIWKVSKTSKKLS